MYWPSMNVAVISSWLAISCAPQRYDYIYISINEDVMEIVKRGEQSHLGEELCCHTSIPLRYRLEREHYEISAALPEGVYDPAIVFEVQSKEESKVYLEYTWHYPCFGTFLASNEPYRLPDPQSASIKFRWRESTLRSCATAEEPQDSQKVFLLEIVDAAGATLGEERIPFSLERNGYYVEADSL